LNSAYTYFGLFWGSIDSYNTLSFYNNNALVASFTGPDLTNPANGDQKAPATNTYVNFYDLPAFDTFQLSSEGFAFEADNIALANNPVPEPATMLLFGTGIAGLAGIARRKRN